jgi:RHS repeat-associated protein
MFAQVTNPLSATHPVDYRSTEAALGLPLPGFVLPGDGRLSGVSLTSNNNRAQTLGLTHDAIGRLTALRSAGYTTYTLAYAYDAASRITARQAGAGSAPASSYAYDAAGQLARIAISDTNALTLLLRLDYAYDAAGNITGITSSRDGAAIYTYDALNRLTGVSSPGLNASYGYDAAGNRTSVDGVAFTYDAGGRLASSSDGASYTYDAAGNLLSRTRTGQTDTFVWDGLGKLTRINYADSSFSEYRYDFAGRRISKRGRDGTTIYYTYLGPNLAQELDANGVVIASYTYDGLDRPVSMYRNGLTYFYLLDHLGSVLGLVDENGVVAATYRYDPWGNVISSTGGLANSLRFTAREWDEESGLYFYRARYYDPQVGRFISRDPIGVRGGMNLYAYVANRPVNLRDPSGLLIDELLDYLFSDSRAEEAKGVVDRADQAMDLAQSAAELADAVENRDDPARGLDALEAIGDIVDTCFGAVGGFFGGLMGGAVDAVQDAPGGVEASERQGQCGSINRNACEMMRDLE